VSRFGSRGILHGSGLPVSKAHGAHDILKKWVYIDSSHEAFEPTMERA
jgi:hypothetical protein